MPEEKPNSTSTAENAEPNVMVEPLADSLPTVADWLPDSVLPYWEMLSGLPLVGALVLGATFFLLAIVVRALLFRSLKRLTTLTQSHVDDAVLDDLRGPVFTTIFCVGLALATQTAQLPIGTNVLVNLVLSAIAVSWMRAALRVSSHILIGLENNPRFTIIEQRTIPLLDLTIKLLTILVGSYVLLLVWGINPIGWLASAGIVGIAVGFAAKDTLANLFSGFFIVADAPYMIGDYINLDSGERGKVSAIGLRSTRLLTRDDVEITIPNGVIANAKIVNESGGPYQKIRTRLPVGAAYGSDVDHVTKVLLAVGIEHNETCAFPEPRIRMRGFGASSLDFDLLVWIENPEDRGRIAHELFMEIYRAFAREGIEIPFTKQDVYIKEMPQWPKQ